MNNPRYAVTSSDIGEVYNNGHAYLVDIFDSKTEAEHFVKLDMIETLGLMNQNDSTIVDWSAHEIWIDANHRRGCVWDIHEIYI